MDILNWIIIAYTFYMAGTYAEFWFAEAKHISSQKAYSSDLLLESSNTKLWNIHLNYTDNDYNVFYLCTFYFCIFNIKHPRINIWQCSVSHYSIFWLRHFFVVTFSGSHVDYMWSTNNSYTLQNVYLANAGLAIFYSPISIYVNIYFFVLIFCPEHLPTNLKLTEDL